MVLGFMCLWLLGCRVCEFRVYGFEGWWVFKVRVLGLMGFGFMGFGFRLLGFTARVGDFRKQKALNPDVNPCPPNQLHSGGAG